MMFINVWFVLLGTLFRERPLAHNLASILQLTRDYSVAIDELHLEEKALLADFCRPAGIYSCAASFGCGSWLLNAGRARRRLLLRRTPPDMPRVRQGNPPRGQLNSGQRSRPYSRSWAHCRPRSMLCARSRRHSQWHSQWHSRRCAPRLLRRRHRPRLRFRSRRRALRRC